VETSDLAAVLAEPPGPLLIDGIGTWLATVFDECGAWPGDPGAAHPGDDGDPARDREQAQAQERMREQAQAMAAVGERCDQLVAAWRRTPARVVAVSDEVGLGVVPATAAGRLFRDALGRLNQHLARESEDVALVVAGRLVPLPI
jgi:adenosylcobinamide kinase/adenosylcobinamide-phosphate guanylyltransferase